MMIAREELGTPTGWEKINPTSVKGITASLVTPTSGAYVGKNAVAALITVEACQVRFTMDGTTVSATVGHIIAAADSYLVIGAINVKKLSFRDTSAGASSVMVTLFH